MSINYPYDTAPIKHLYDTDTWDTIPPTPVALVDLVPTQPDVSIASIRYLTSDGPRGDPCPHVVLHAGRHYIHNGHHRYILALSRGEAWLNCRIAPQPPEAD